jgi:uncharacterized protein DUF3866
VPSFRSGTVDAITDERRGLQRVLVDGEPAYVLTDVIGPVAVGDRVVMNTTAVELGLGTGGWHVVHWNLTRDAWSSPVAGREMKVRYTSLQVEVDVPSAGELASVPVVGCLLHSQLAAVALAFHETAPGQRLVYVMTDGGALPVAISDLVFALRERGLVHRVVTAGHGFGGDVEATTVEHALALATANLEADAVVVGPGPGTLGVGQAIAFTGRDVIRALDAAEQPILAVRYSGADARDRHQGVSHHARDVLLATRRAVCIPLPRGEPDPGIEPHFTAEVEVPDLLPALVELGVTSMGRRPAEDPLFWAYAGAAGVVAARHPRR